MNRPTASTSPSHVDKSTNSADSAAARQSQRGSRNSTKANRMPHESTGLVIDSTPEVTEKYCNDMLTMLDSSSNKNQGGFLHSLHKTKQKVMDQTKKREHPHSNSAPVPHTTIISKCAVGEHSEGKLLYESSREQLDDDEKPTSELYSFVIEDPNKVYAQFMQAHKCYDVIPMNAKLVVLDVNLDVRKAFYAMVYNSVRSALVWNADTEELCGMLTITDFINMLIRLYHKDKKKIDKSLEAQLIREWREILFSEGKLKTLTAIDAPESLYKAVQLLADSKYHRIPVKDEIGDNPLYFLTHKRILRFLYLYLDELPRPDFMNESVRTLGVGTYEDLQYVYPDTPLIDCLARLTSRNMSAVPVVDRKTLVVVDIYARFDAIGLAVQQSYDRLDDTVADALKHRKSSNWFEGVQHCYEADTLWSVVQKLVYAEVHGLVVVDERNSLRGVITLSDVLQYLVLAHS